eukprot:1142516-Pelagomonas_calceolata.AAC.4
MQTGSLEDAVARCLQDLSAAKQLEPAGRLKDDKRTPGKPSMYNSAFIDCALNPIGACPQTANLRVGAQQRLFALFFFALQKNSDGLKGYGMGADGGNLSKRAFVEAVMANVVSAPKHSPGKQVCCANFYFACF